MIFSVVRIMIWATTPAAFRFWFRRRIVPVLNISYSGNTVTVTGRGVRLEAPARKQQPHYTRRRWSVSGGLTTCNGTNYLNLTSPTGNVFFRLGNPETPKQRSSPEF